MYRVIHLPLRDACGVFDQNGVAGYWHPQNPLAVAWCKTMPRLPKGKVAEICRVAERIHAQGARRKLSPFVAS